MKTKKPPTKRRLQAIKTKKRLFRSAVTLMDDFGYDNVTIEDISQKAGVSVGAFYHYYKSKTDILLELYVHIDDYFEMIVEPLVNGDDVFENIRVFLTHYADYNAEKGHSHVKLLFETHDRLFVDKSRYMYALFRRVIEQGKASGQLTQEYTVDEIEDSYFVFARGVIYDWILHESDYDLHSRMLKHIDLLEKSYRA